MGLEIKTVNTFKTDQENFWAGEFGSNYIERNNSRELLASNLNYFSSIFKNTNSIESVLEFGANIGMNMHAMKLLLPKASLDAVEINPVAYEELKQIPDVTAENCSIFDYKPNQKFDFVFTKGVLIHINPDELDGVYQKMYDASSRYICVGEYYNPAPVAIPYRGHTDRLFKRDFAGEILDKFPDLELVDYGFSYRRDNNFKQDDITWFLMEKVIAKFNYSKRAS